MIINVERGIKSMDGGMITTALSNVTTVFNQAVTMITGNEVAMLFVGIPIIGAGIGLFHRLIRR